MGYFKDTLKGISWMAGLQGVRQGLAIIKVAILARILLPSQFGVYGIALLVLGLLEVMTETGINIFLIQEKDKTEDYLDSAWVVSIARGLIIAVIIILTSPFVVSFFKVQNVLPLLYLTAGIAIARGFINPMVVSYQKSLQFQKEFTYQTFLYMVDFVVAVSVGYFTKSESAMVISMLVAAIVEVVSSFIIFKAKPRFRFDLTKLKKVIGQGKWITGAGVFGYLFQNVDNIVVGRFLGSSSLGLYQQSYRISTLPVSGVSEIFSKVTLPVYVNIAGDVKRLQKAFIRTFLVTTGLSLPFALLILLFSHPLIIIFLGEKWLEAEASLRVLAVFGIFRSIVYSSYSLFLSLKKQKVVMLSELAGIVGISIFIIPFVNQFGLVGAGYAAIIGALFSLPVIFLNFFKTFGYEKP